MSDNRRQYRAIRTTLIQGYPGEPTGRVARHVATLAALLSGIVASKSTQLPQVAAHVPTGAQPESRVKRFVRWLRNAQGTAAVYCIPYAQVLLAHWAVQTLVLVIEGSVVGRGCIALMIHVLYKGRALPRAGLVRQGKQGHCPEDFPIAVVEQGHALLPPGAQVVVLGDGACHGTTLQHTVQAYGWASVVRTGSHLTVLWAGEHFRCETVGACSKPGTLVALRDVRRTEAADGPLMRLWCWAQEYKAPLDLVTNMAAADEACRL